MTDPHQPGVPEYGTPAYERWYAEYFPAEYAAWRAEHDRQAPPSRPRRRRAGFAGWITAHPGRATLAGLGAFVALIVGIAVADPSSGHQNTPGSNAAAITTTTTASSASQPTPARTTASHTATTTPATTRSAQSTHRPGAHRRPVSHPTHVATHRATPTPTTATVIRHGLAMPNPALTPGAAFAGVTTTQVCTAGWSSAHRDVTESERRAVFTTYGIPYAYHAQYELDHLISLELGGSNAEANLWPEPQTQNDTSGPDKDALEDHLHALVCAGQISLATAQRAIAADWVAAWNSYENVPVTRPTHTAPTTRAPVPTHAPVPTRAPPAQNPAGATARCNDGTFSFAQHHQGACSHHGGVAQWLD